MATRGSIPTVMKAAGIDMLPASAGIPIVRQELTRPAPTREIVIAGKLGILDEEIDPGGGVDTESMLDAQNQPGVMVGTLRGGAAGLTMSVELDPREQPFLHDHQIDGTPVLPGVMGLEAFAEVAALAYPDLHVAAIEDVDFHAPFKFYRHEPRQVTVEASFTRDGEDVLAHCRLTGSRVLAGQDEPQRTVHFTGTVRLAAEPPHPAGGSIPDRKGAEVTAESVYSIYFHGHAYQVVANAWRNGDTVAGAMPETLAANHSPDSAVTIVGPRSLELCFQTAGVHEIGTTGVMGLPLHVDRYIPAPADGKPQGRLTALVEAHDDGSFSASVVDEAGTGFGALSGYRTVRLPGAIDDDLLAPLRKAMTGEA